MTEINNTINWKKINLYILIAFGFCWTIALIMKLTNVEYGSTTSVIIIAGLYMPGPALSTFIIQKFIYKEGFKKYGWRFDKKNLKWFLNTILIFIAIILLTFIIIGLFGNTKIISQFGQVDFSQHNFNLQFKELLKGKVKIDKIKLPNIPSSLFFVLMMAEGIIAGLTVNIPFMFGEEFGWRGLMLKETQKLGFIKSNFFIGLVWGLWHLPIILMGHNYPNHPYFGIVMMCLMTIALAPIFAYVRLKTKSILGTCILHGMINATGALFTLYVANANELYSSIAGWAGIVACSVMTILILQFDKTFVKDYSKFESELQ
ncbi:MAG: CPBP family intramembrane metalloprotease [Bacteroidetes bacterium]|nr:CPBP family intramembrane metalloprotease [Bacteroidota bacterium]